MLQEKKEDENKSHSIGFPEKARVCFVCVQPFVSLGVGWWVQGSRVGLPQATAQPCPILAM